ncbi:TetR/AcrR family transcriptional regulator [Micrococcus flavus]|uniref:AcrR family transcriptional regulator n=1 Tax=Micrococcus flavus TaxID=384602 RepID=A0A4Y8X5E6_9MICC|nr:TetR/AcrR family transcriptional regulator [Micrococcus flavus]MBB4883162.1 AcrR family transcriptional regulator [Micrococcus flavus]TFI04565.1 TetR/AcrR family transcriptional regulator [Micrococcus flavus]GGK42895.1 hypothetical protein GCM10007073_07430 [Micrococcus flavus]
MSEAPVTSAAPGRAPARTARERAKARRRADLLAAAARLFAAGGYDAARLEDIGAAAGVSGPAVYRHFAGKAAVLVEILETASTGLLEGGHDAVRDLAPGAESLRALIAFHTDFAVDNRDVIRVQDRDMSSLPDADRTAIARVQRRYIELWAAQLRHMHPHEDHATAVFRVQAVLGLLNSTPHSVRRAPSDRSARRQTLVSMAWAAASAPLRPAAPVVA